jgi:hypothetical protein
LVNDVSAAEHEHEFPWDGREVLPCACGASLSAIEAVLDAAADDARKVVEGPYYTGCRLRQELEALELWLCNAPPQVLEELEATHPGVYLIHNDAPRSEAAVFELMDAVGAELPALGAEGINVVGYGPTQDGYLNVRVMGDVPTAQARLDGMFGSDVARVEYGEPARALPRTGH